MAALSRFGALVALPESQLDLAEGALLIGAAADPGVDLPAWLHQIDRYAQGVTDLAGLRHRLFGELGLRGDTENYYNPENSFLHRVLTRRVGIPISLSVLTIEVGRRAGIRLEGIGMPGHFLVGVPPGAGARGAKRPLYLDAFNGGELLDLAGCEARFRTATGSGPEVAFGPHLLSRVGAHAILTRMLANLHVVYELRQSGPDLEWVSRMRLALPDASGPEALALASALELQGRFLDAARELEERARSDTGSAEELMGAARRLRARFN